MKSISSQILTYISISLCVVFIGRYFYGIHSRTQFETERLKQNSIRICTRLANFSVKPILNHDLESIQSYLNVEGLDENIRSIQIFDQNNRFYGGVLHTNGKVHIIKDGALPDLDKDSIVRPVLYQGKTIGKVVLYPDKEPLLQYIGELKLLFFVELGMFFLVLAVIQLFIIKIVVINPLSSLRNWVSSINTDEKIPEPKLFHSTEIDIVTVAISQLADRLISALKENISKSNLILEKETLITAIGTNLTGGMIFRLTTHENGLRQFTYLSGSFKKLYGYSPEEGIADPLIIFGSVVKEDVQSLLDAETASKRDLSTYRCEVRMINPDGTIRISRFVSTPTLMEDGSISWDGIELDITDLKKAQADLQQNQFLLESITEGLPDSIFAKDINGCFLFVNSALANRVNKKPQDFLGKDTNVLFLPDEANKTLEKDFEIMKSGVIQTYEEEKMTLTGKAFYLTTKGPIMDGESNIVGLFGISRDITKQKREEEALRVSQEKFEFAFDSSPNAILIQDEGTGRYLGANASATSVFGYSKEEILGKTPLELSLYKDLANRKKVLETLKRELYIDNMEIVGRHKLGMDLNLLLTVVRRFIDNKPFLYINVQDVTERKKVELELQKLNLDKDRFISILGHDLRGPVNSISTLLDILNKNFNDMSMEEIEEIIHLVYQSTKRTSRLLDDVLLWATAKSGKMEFNPQRINFKKDCKVIAELLQFTASVKKIDVELICEDSLVVYADKNMLDTVLRNLISNALKFTREGGNIKIAAKKNSDETVVSIIDNGVGISTKDIDKIFDKAQLFSSIGTNEEKGTGFGLKLCQEFIEKHGGKIWVESEAGIGSAFHFSLPNEG
ncbi:PAS domain S-box protein [Flavobacterium aestuarii]|uniref:PAS domain S-box protein n=1 Tax=Flavobacterium aestuarii TaxID=3149227 RepID=UPI0032B5CE19